MAFETKIWIKELNVQQSLSGLDNVITTIRASMSGRETRVDPRQQNKRNFVFIEDEQYTLSSPVLSAFTAFESLTENDCINFIKSSDRYSTIYGELTSRIKTNILQELQELHDFQVTEFPWE